MATEHGTGTLIPEGDLLELVGELRGRASAVRQLREAINTTPRLLHTGNNRFADSVRLAAKESAYDHAAELLQGVLDRARTGDQP